MLMSKHSRNPSAKRRTFAASVFATLLLACVSGPRPIPDQRIPHRVAERTKVVIWVEQPGGAMKKVEVELHEGWWIASPQIVEP